MIAEVFISRVSVNPLISFFLGVFIALAIGTAFRWFFYHQREDSVAPQRMDSLKVWWLLFFLWTIATFYSPHGYYLLFLLASGLGLIEFFKLIEARQPLDRSVKLAVLLISLIHYGLIWSGQGEWAAWARRYSPLMGMLTIAAVSTLSVNPKDFLRVTGGVYWGWFCLVYNLSYALMLMEGLPVPAIGGVGWLLMLLLITVINDIAQALVGRRWGRRSILPVLSPGKTWEGLWGGFFVSLLLTILMANWMSTWNAQFDLWLAISIAALAGCLISVAGFLGDINMSAAKRDAGVKDSGNLFMGMGGMLDRIDSLTFTAPIFYYYVVMIDHLSAT